MKYKATINPWENDKEWQEHDIKDRESNSIDELIDQISNLEILRFEEKGVDYSIALHEKDKELCSFWISGCYEDGVLKKHRINETVHLLTGINESLNQSETYQNNYIMKCNKHDQFVNEHLKDKIPSLKFIMNPLIDYVNQNGQRETLYKSSYFNNNKQIYVLERKTRIKSDKFVVDAWQFKENFIGKQAMQFVKDWDNEQQKQSNTRQHEPHGHKKR